jgi:uncharacterized protein (TIGR04255 family)
VNQNVSVDYERPPVVETILGVQFDPLPDFSNAHQGLFWTSLGSEWPKIADSAPLEPQYERFTEESRWVSPSIAFRMAQTVPSRLQITNRNADRLIQLQNGRLHLNWLGRGGANYPRFQQMLSEFLEVVDRFDRFTVDRGLQTFRPNQWEITYINHIPKGTVWKTPQDWGFFRPMANLREATTSVRFETFSGEWHFLIPDNLGRLHVQWQHGKSHDPPQELVSLTLTARGPLESDPQDIQADLGRVRTGLEVGHDAIVLSFRDLMSQEANNYWGLKR